MLQRATFTPEGGLPAYGTDAWSKEQALIEPYTALFAPAREKTAMGWAHTGLRAEAATHLTTRLTTRLTTGAEAPWLAAG
jgi:hypothetical protein